MINAYNNIEELIDDLTYLRKDAGFTTLRIKETGILLRVLGGRDQIFSTLQTRFVSAIQSLDKKESEVLMMANGLSPEYADLPLLKDRRTKYAEQINRGVDTGMGKEKAAIKEVALCLLNAYYSSASLPATLPIPHGKYLMEFLSIVTVIKNRIFIEHEQMRRIIAFASGLDRLRYHSNYRMELIPLEGLRVETEYVEKGSLHTLVFPKELSRGMTHQFAFKEVLEEAELEKDYPEIKQDKAGQIFQVPSLQYRQSVRFHGDKPPVIWYYDKLSDIERPGESSRDNQLAVGRAGIATYDFPQQQSGFYSGIAWRW